MRSTIWRDGLALDRQPGRRRIGDADAGEEEPHVVVDFRDRADGGARVAAGGLLLDGDGRRQPVDLVDVGLLHHLQELPRIGGERFHVAALALGVDGVEGERGFSRARQPGHDDEAVARQVEVDVLEIMLARPADGDEFARSRLSRTRAGAGVFLAMASRSEGEVRRRLPPPTIRLLRAPDKRRVGSLMGEVTVADRGGDSRRHCGGNVACCKEQRGNPLARLRNRKAFAIAPRFLAG